VSRTDSMHVDVVILGGGAAGLWLLDDLRRAGFAAVLLEANALGAGQTIASQGIIHGGLKYTLDGLLSQSAASIRDMPMIWRRCLAGEREPDLRGTRLRAEFCYLWRTTSLTSKLGMLGARAGLRVGPSALTDAQRPPALADCPGVVARLDEQVIDTGSMLDVLARRHRGQLLRIDVASGLELEVEAPGRVSCIRLINPADGAPLDLVPRHVVLAAGTGNERLLEQAGLPSVRAQRRPLHMVLVRGALPDLCGHCVDGMRTRATITSAKDMTGGCVWQVGGQIAEDGVSLDPPELAAHARRELTAILPAVSLDGCEWSTYRVDRAEPSVRGRRRPAAEVAALHGNVIVGWPTKLALVPRLATQIRTLLPHEPAIGHLDPATLDRWVRPRVAVPPWEEQRSWFSAD